MPSSLCAQELNGECEKLEEQIAEIRSEIEKYKGQGLNTDNQRKKILKDLEERLQRTEAKAEQYEKKYEAAMKTVNTLKVGIASIFKKIGCDTPANLEMLGNEGVTESNMMQCALHLHPLPCPLLLPPLPCPPPVPPSSRVY